MSRIVTRLPLGELWDDAGHVVAERQRDLVAADIAGLLRLGPVRFVVADIGHPLRWVPIADCFRFWKDEVKSRVGDPAGSSLDDFPGGYSYFAAEWVPADGPPVVLLESCH